MAYLGAAALMAGPARHSGKAAPAIMALALAMLAVIGHGWLLFNATLLSSQGSLSLANSASLIGLMLAVLALAFFGQAGWRGLIGFFMAMAGLAVLLTVQQPQGASMDTPLWHFLGHVLVATLAWSMFAAAAVLALLTAAKDRFLRAVGSGGWAASLPPLDSMERLMFGAISAGFALLSLAIFSGLIFVEDLSAQHLTHKAVLTLLAWLLFATLLFGRWRLGWRGRRAINWTVTGFAILALAYFGSRIVLEVVLGRQWG